MKLDELKNVVGAALKGVDTDKCRLVLKVKEGEDVELPFDEKSGGFVRVEEAPETPETPAPETPAPKTPAPEAQTPETPAPEVRTDSALIRGIEDIGKRLEKIEKASVSSQQTKADEGRTVVVEKEIEPDAAGNMPDEFWG